MKTRIWRALLDLIQRDRAERDMDEELRSHLDRQIEHNVAQGLSPEEARYAALRLFGGIEQVKEQCRDMRGLNFIESVARDLQYGLRQLRRNPGFTAVAVITLALGIGANTAIFSVVNTVLLRPLPYKDPGRLVMIGERGTFSRGLGAVVGPDFVAWQDHNHVFQSLGAFWGLGGGNLTGPGEPVHVRVTGVTVGFFPMLGVRPILGRTFTADEGEQGQNHVALLSESFWRTKFGGSPKVLGETIHLDNKPYIVVGVMPGDVRYPGKDLWTPIALNTALFAPRAPDFQSGPLALVGVLGRLKPGVTRSRAESELSLIMHRMDHVYGPGAVRFRAQERVGIIPLHEAFVTNVRSLLLILLGAVAFVLLIACANVANLLLSRAASRGKEIAVRAALGAGRARLTRQLLTESLMLAIVGGVLGFVTGFWAVHLLRRLIPPTLPSEVKLDLQVLGFVVGIGLIAVVLFGLVPAVIASRFDLSEALGTGGLHTGSGARAHWLRSILVVTELGLSLVLLIGAGLLARTFLRLMNVPLGFNPHHLLTVHVERPLTNGLNTPSQVPFFYEVLTRLRALPGVQEAGATTHTPVSPFEDLEDGFTIQGGSAFRPHESIGDTSISPGYFRTMEIQLLKGRFFDTHDAGGTPGVVIMNETLAREAFKGSDPVGQRISFNAPKGPWLSVVGVVAETRNYVLEQQPQPELFSSYPQSPLPFATFVLRTKGNPLALAREVRKTIESVDKNQAVSQVQTMDEVIASSVAPQRFRMLLLGLFALLALMLAAVGMYGVMSYSVSQRTHEIGVRMALGARTTDVLRQVLSQGMILALVGVAIGVVAAFALTRFLSSLLYSVKPSDPFTFAIVSLVLTGVALLACYIPARRAAKVDPMVALRHE
jgi:predicted permease